MPSRNLEAVRFALECFGRNDFEPVRPLLHPEVRWHSSGVFPGFDPVYAGPDQVGQWWQDLQEPFASFTIHVEREIDLGERILLLVRFDAVGRESGVAVKLPFAQLFEFDDGLVTSFTPYGSWDEALAAAGLT